MLHISGNEENIDVRRKTKSVHLSSNISGNTILTILFLMYIVHHENFHLVVSA